MWGRHRPLATLAVSVPADPGTTSHPQQPRDAFATDPDPERHLQLGVDPRGPIGAAGHGVDVDDSVRQVGIGGVAVRQRSSPPLIEPRSGHSQHPAGHRDINPVVGEFLDQPERHFGRTFSLAK